jgi:predicted nuclease of predicted toxin-antitoxin system
MARLYANENFPLPVVDELRRLGHDVLTVQEAGKGNQSMSDDEVLAFSIREGRTLLSLNRKHFIALHNEKPKHDGIIVCTFDPDFVALAHRIGETIEQEVQLAGRLIRIQRPQRIVARPNEAASASREPGTDQEPDL